MWLLATVPLMSTSQCPPAIPLAHPFLRWAGGKTRLLPEIEKHLPEVVGDYFEPFLGGGAVFWHLRAQGRIRGKVVLSDANPDLINAYKQIQTDPDAVYATLSALFEGHAKQGKEHFLAVRRYPGCFDAVGLAARAIYLTHISFGGNWRVNAKGEYNNTYGWKKAPPISLDHFRACSEALRGVDLRLCGYGDTLRDVRPGVFVFLDPPYVPISATSNFTGYTSGGFGPSDQWQLAGAVRYLDWIGADYVLCNSSADLCRNLYRGLPWRMVTAPRSIKSRGSATQVQEIMVSNVRARADVGGAALAS